MHPCPLISCGWHGPLHIEWPFAVETMANSARFTMSGTLPAMRANGAVWRGWCPRHGRTAVGFTQRPAAVMLVMEARALNRFQARKSCLLVAKLNVR